MQKQPNNRKKLVALVQDLMFTVKINDAAKKAGLAAEFVKSEDEVMAKASEKPTAIIIDLNHASVNPLNVISRLKEEFGKVSLIGYLSHVQGDLKKQAHDVGCDIVMTRSAFSQNLPSILKRHADLH